MGLLLGTSSWGCEGRPTKVALESKTTATVTPRFDPDAPPKLHPPGDPRALPVDALAGPPDLKVRHRNDLPLRLAQGPDGRVYVSDGGSGSVFVYSAKLELLQELSGLEGALGIAVDRAGLLHVGSDTRDCIEVYDPVGQKVREFGQGTIRMPNDLAIGPTGQIFTADSRSDAVWVHAPDGRLLRRIGRSGSEAGELRFPAALTLGQRGAAWELFVADQGNGRVQAFTLEGAFLRSLGSKVQGSSGDWKGRFVKIQSLAFDGLDRLHVLDSAMHTIQLLDPLDGGFLGHYGRRGQGPGELELPLDLMITADGRRLVTNAGHHRIESLSAEVLP